MGSGMGSSGQMGGSGSQGGSIGGMGGSMVSQYLIIFFPGVFTVILSDSSPFFGKICCNKLEDFT